MKYDAVSEKLNDVCMNGFQEEEYGSCQEEGFSRALIITDEIVGIIQEDDQGFIDYITFEGQTRNTQARHHWEALSVAGELYTGVNVQL